MAGRKHLPPDHSPERRPGKGAASAGASRLHARTVPAKESRDPAQLIIIGRIASDERGDVAWKLVGVEQLETGIEAESHRVVNVAEHTFATITSSMSADVRGVFHRILSAGRGSELELRFTGTLLEAEYTFGSNVLGAGLSRAVEHFAALTAKNRSGRAFRLDYADLTWIDAPVHGRDVEADTGPSRANIDFDELVLPPLAQVAPGLSDISTRIQSRNDEFAEALREELRSLEGTPFPSAAEALSFARGLRRILLSLGHRVECSEPARDGSGQVCGTPSFVDCYEHGSAPFWVFRFHHVGDDRKHGHFHALPRLAVVRAPPDRRRKHP